jgi:hypothetical protein
MSRAAAMPSQARHQGPFRRSAKQDRCPIGPAKQNAKGDAQSARVSHASSNLYASSHVSSRSEPYLAQPVCVQRRFARVTNPCARGGVASVSDLAQGCVWETPTKDIERDGHSQNHRFAEPRFNPCSCGEFHDVYSHPRRTYSGVSPNSEPLRAVSVRIAMFRACVIKPVAHISYNGVSSMSGPCRVNVRETQALEPARSKTNAKTHVLFKRL